MCFETLRVVLHLEQRAIGFIVLTQFIQQFVRIGNHAAELPHAKQLAGTVFAQATYTHLTVKRACARALQTNRYRKNQARNKQNKKSHTGSNNVESSLHNAIEPTR